MSCQQLFYHLDDLWIIWLFLEIKSYVCSVLFNSLVLYKTNTTLNDPCITNKNNFELRGFASKRMITGFHTQQVL